MGIFDELKNETKKTVVVRKTAERVLKDANKTSSESTMSGPEIYKIVLKEWGDDFKDMFTSDSYQDFLPQIARQMKSNITTEGRRRGYYLIPKALAEAISTASESEDSPEQASKNSTTRAKRDRIEKEKQLYPPLVSWLCDQGYRARDVSASRRGERWGNPDVAGLMVTSGVHDSMMDIEIATIEAKLSLHKDSWRTEFFEAVSHRRFSNRAYFCIGCPVAQFEKLRKEPELRYYSQLYGVGVIIDQIDDNMFLEIANGRHVLKKEDVEFS